MAKLKKSEGWSFGKDSSILHYFRNGVSLCGKYRTKKEFFTEGTPEESRCLVCERILSKEKRSDEAQKIYVVTAGCYSAYHIVGVFSTKEKAEEFVKKYNKTASDLNKAEIEEYILDQLERDLPPGHKLFFVRMTREGVVREVEEVKLSDFYGFDFGFDLSGNLFCTVSAKDQAHAVKIVNERRVYLIASNQWGEK
jgi:hypothetical protein